MTAQRTIHYSDGRAVESTLIVARDWTTTGAGRWVLYWTATQAEDFGRFVSPAIGYTDGRCYQKTMRAAIQLGQRLFGIVAKKHTF